MTDTQKNDYADLRAKVKAIKEDNGWSWDKLGQECGVPGGTVSNFVGGTYGGKIDRVAGELEKWLKARTTANQLRQRAAVSPSFQETPTSRQMMDAMAYAQTMSDIVVIASDPGIGKSSAIEEYARNNPNVWDVFVESSTKTISAMLGAMRESMGMPNAYYSRSLADVKRKMKNCGGLLIFDESQRLNVEQLEQIRDFNELCKVGIVLFGNRNLHARIEGKSRAVEYAQFFSRIGMRLQIETPKDHDVIVMIKAWGVEGEEEQKLLRAIGNKPGALRNIDKTMKLATIAANGAGDQVNSNYIRAAYERLSKTAR